MSALLSIILLRNAISPEVRAGQHVWPLRVSAQSTTLTDCACFVFHTSSNPGVLPQFEAVASVQQMQELPVIPVAPQGDGTIVPYYRSSELTFPCSDSVEREELWTAIQEEVQRLCEGLQALYGASVSPETAVTITATADYGGEDITSPLDPQAFIPGYSTPGVIQTPLGLQGSITKGGYLRLVDTSTGKVYSGQLFEGEPPTS